MGIESGGNPAPQPENPNGSPNSDSSITGREDSVLIAASSFSLADLIAMHLQTCQQCYTAMKHLRPVGLGQKSPLCDTYWELQLQHAKEEGRVNNIVAYTEFGDEAPKRGRLE